jgi:predicted transcriptional regulator
MSLMNVMVEKGLLRQKPKGRAFEYRAKVSQVKVQSRMVNEFLGRVFDGSASALVVHLLEGIKPEPDELNEIRKAIAEYTSRKGERQ